MLAHLPHPTLPPNPPTSKYDSLTASLQIRLPSPITRRTWKSDHRSNTTSDLASDTPLSRSNSPSRSSTFLPFLKLTLDQSISPELVSPEEAAEFEHPSSSQESLQPKSDIKSGKLASWFSGVSEPVNITLIPSPVKEKNEPFFDSAEMEGGSTRTSTSREVDTMTRRPLSRFQKSNSSLPAADQDSVGTKLAFWRSNPASNSRKCNIVDDELTALDVETALFPSENNNKSSPQAFKELQANARTTILRLQSAYQQSLQSMRAVTSEKHVLKDELEAAQTRSEHLKVQMANMAATSANQESALQSMAKELVVLRQRMREDAEYRSKSLRLVTSDPSDADAIGNVGNNHHRRRRQSAGSSESEDSSSNSVFSVPPVGTSTPMSAADATPELYQTPTFHDIVIEPVKECQKCHGVQSSEAWDVVHMLKEEGRELKARIAQYETANEDALGLLEVVSFTR